MALRNQPYLPLYVKDFLTDEKLIECSAETTGVYIRLMCIMHNAQDYGQLKLSDKYNDKDIIKNYADMLTKQMPYSYEVIYRSLEELLREKVVFFMKNILTQKRMYNDGILSRNRAKAGSIGGKHTKQNLSKTSSKSEANTEYININEIDIDIEYYKLTNNIIELFNEYITLRKKNKLSNSNTVIKRLLDKLLEYGKTEDEQKEIIEKAIIGNWKDFYEIDNKKKKEVVKYETVR